MLTALVGAAALLVGSNVSGANGGETPDVAKKQKENPTVFRQPQPTTVRSGHGLDTRYFRSKRHPQGLGVNLNVGPQHSKSNVYAATGITTVLTDPNFRDASEEAAVVRGVQRMPLRARGIPNISLDTPNEPNAKRAAYRSNIYYEPEQAEIHYIGDNKHIGIPETYERNTELGVFHYPRELYRPDARTEVKRRMVAAGKLYYPHKTRVPHSEIIQEAREGAAVAQEVYQ